MNARYVRKETLDDEERMSPVDDPQYRYVPDDTRTNRALAWLPLLLIPIFLLLAWWAFNPNQSNIYQQNGGTEFGVGGAPDDTTPTPSMMLQPTASPTVSPTISPTVSPVEEDVLTPTNFPRNNL